MIDALVWVSVFGGSMMFAAAAFWALSYRGRPKKAAPADRLNYSDRPRQL